MKSDSVKPSAPVRTFPHTFWAYQSADDTSAHVPQVTLLSWPIASRYRCLLHMILDSLVRTFLHPSFADQSADDASSRVPQVTLLSWPIASRYRCFMHIIPMESPVRTSPHPSFAVRWRYFRECSIGDIVVLDKCESLTEFYANSSGITGKNIPVSIFRGVFHWRYFRECSTGDIVVLAKCESLTVFYAKDSGMIGKNIPVSIFRGAFRWRYFC
jgi:hypothetical protein